MAKVRSSEGDEQDKRGKIQRKKWGITSEPPRAFVHVHCAEHPCSLPAVGLESCVCIVPLEVVPAENSTAVSLQSVAGDEPLRLLRRVPVQLHRGRADCQVSRL